MNEQTPQPAKVSRHPGIGHLSGVWLVPIVAAVIALYLFGRSYYERGPEITISFNTAEGITAGQTQVKYKAVSLGTVDSIRLDAEAKGVEVHVRMNKEAKPYLTDHARFWVVRPRITSGSISGVETIISGAYIQCDPGVPNGKQSSHFKGLEEPSATRSDVPGKTFVLEADRIGSVTTGSPVFFRDVEVGEVLSYDLGNGFGPIKLSIFVRYPYDTYIRSGSRFWNASGFWVEMGAGGFHVQLHSLQSILAGGIDFFTPDEQKEAEQAPEGSTFKLYPSQDKAQGTTLHRRIAFVSYFQSSIKNLTVDAPVTLYGIRIGTVTGMNLEVDPKTASVRVRVDYEIEPERVSIVMQGASEGVFDLARKMVQKGLRARLASDNLITGQKSISLEFVPNAPPAQIAMDKQSIVLPAGPAGGMDSINEIPFQDIGNHLNNLLAHMDDATAGPDLRNSIHTLSRVMTEAATLLQKADQGMTPALERLPQISEQLQEAVTHANGALASVDQHSDFQRDARRTMDQISDAARSIKLLVDFLNTHPEALIRGRNAKEAE